MSVSPEDIRALSTLAMLGIPEAEVPQLAQQIERIVAFVSLLEEATPDADDPRLPDTSAPLRTDEVRVPEHDPPLSQMAPQWREGFFIVPNVITPDTS